MQVLNDHGYYPDDNGKYIKCVFHEDNRPSAKLFDNGSYHCWAASCQTHINSGFDAIMQLEECTFEEAIKIAEEQYGIYFKKENKVDNRKLKSLVDSITSMVIEVKPKLFLSVYKTMDELVELNDLDKLQKLYMKLSRGEIK